MAVIIKPIPKISTNEINASRDLIETLVLIINISDATNIPRATTVAIHEVREKVTNSPEICAIIANSKMTLVLPYVLRINPQVIGITIQRSSPKPFGE